MHRLRSGLAVSLLALFVLGGAVAPAVHLSVHARVASAEATDGEARDARVAPHQERDAAALCLICEGFLFWAAPPPEPPVAPRSFRSASASSAPRARSAW